ncbi:hypothetical protein C8J57DRAFT_1240663 [Mycena rebaudengoi]|nr:hypothetical protein C8J57DRAFT_1240663 [Mycena rebaudengoi]
MITFQYNLFKPILDLLCEHVGPKALQASFEQMKLALFYNASALQLPEGVQSWICILFVHSLGLQLMPLQLEYAITANEDEPGFEWQNGEEQGRNNFYNDNAYIEARFLLHIVKDHDLQPLHIILIKHVSSAATHLLVIFADGRYMCDCCMGTNMGIPC